MIGVSLPASVLLERPANEAQEDLLAPFGSVYRFLKALQNEGVSSVELRDAHAPVSVSDMVFAVQVIKAAGMHVSLHILFDDIPFDAYLTGMLPVLEAAKSEQERLNLTVHLYRSEEETIRLLSQWRFGTGFTVSLENMRVKTPENDFMFLESVDRIVSAADGDGITWDLGHYAFNRGVKGEAQSTLPGKRILRKVIHTHIHAFSYGKTHFPVFADNEAIRGYVNALRAAGYGGIYNLELEPERYHPYFAPAEGMLTSVRTLAAMLK